MTTDPQLIAALQRIADQLNAIDQSLMLIGATVEEFNNRDSVRNPV